MTNQPEPQTRETARAAIYELEQAAAEIMALRARVEQAEQERDAGRAVCLHCEEVLHYDSADKESRRDVVRRMHAHEAQCANNPLRKRAEAADQQLATVQAQLSAWRPIVQWAAEMECCGCDRCMEMGIAAEAALASSGADHA